MKTTKPTKTARATCSANATQDKPKTHWETSEEYYARNQRDGMLILDHELIEDARIEARLDAIYDREEREGALYRDE